MNGSTECGSIICYSLQEPLDQEETRFGKLCYQRMVLLMGINLYGKEL